MFTEYERDGNTRPPDLPLEKSVCKRNLFAGQEATVRTEHEKADWFQIMKEIKLGLDNVTLLI